MVNLLIDNRDVCDRKCLDIDELFAKFSEVFRKKKSNNKLTSSYALEDILSE